MVRIIEIDIGQLGVRLPCGEVGMVIAQPHVELTSQEPFSITPQSRDAAMANIDVTLTVALNRPHGLDKTHFTVFPEYSLPGLVAFDRITTAMAKVSWPVGTIVIGGIDGLSCTQFAELIRRPNSNYDNHDKTPDRIRDDHWVNCCVTWVKLESGEVRAWIQPKIEPAWPERNINNQSMFNGQFIFLFHGTYSNTNAPYRFATLICFDWIGTREGRRVWEWLLDSINQTAGALNAELPLTWLFVAQCNPKPSHTSFMNQIQPFFNPMQFPNVIRDKTCLVMANVAGNPVPGKAEEYGRSAVIFATSKFTKPECHPTYCSGGPLQRPGDPLENFKDAVFRERGACIHSFRQQNPRALPSGAAGMRYALAETTVHSLLQEKDPRTPNGLVPAIVKWVNDELDDPAKSLETAFPHVPLAGTAREAHHRLVTELRWLAPAALNKTILIASPGTDGSPDQWTETQSEAVRHVLHTFSILEAALYPATFHGNGTQASIVAGDRGIEVVAVAGQSHEECDKHVRSQLPVHRHQLLLISRDKHNTSWDPRMTSIFDQATEPTKEINFTDPISAITRLSYQKVLNAYQSADTQPGLQELIDAEIT